MKTMRGFTVVEVLIVIAIIGIVTTVALPNIRDMNANSRQLTTANLFIASFNHARNEAITRSTDVDVSAVGDDWKNGWTITTTEDGVTTTIASYEQMAPELKVTGMPDITDPAAPVEDVTSDPPVSFQYNRQGRLALADGENMIGVEAITICDKRIEETGRVVIFAPIGRVSIATVTCQ